MASTRWEELRNGNDAMGKAMAWEGDDMRGADPRRRVEAGLGVDA